MKIGLVDCDSHNFPNLPLMKLSAYHKQKGDQVSFAEYTECYDRLYISKIFTESGEPELPESGEIIRGGSGYDLINRLPDEVEHIYPDYGLYPELTKNTAYGFLTRGCPRKNHGFCITPQKDGCVSRKNADLKEFWNGQKNVVLLDQNLLACRERIELLKQLADSGAWVDFQGGLDIRFLNGEILALFKRMKVSGYHFAWDNPREDLTEQFQFFSGAGFTEKRSCGVYVLTNYWSSLEEDLFRIYTLLDMGFSPFVMIYDKQKYVDEKGRWHPDVAYRYSEEQLRKFKVCQHLQRWCARIWIMKRCPEFEAYEPYRRWLEKGQPVPTERSRENDTGEKNKKNPDLPGNDAERIGNPARV